VSSPVIKWIVSASQTVPGLGRGELLQSEFEQSHYRARIVLNSYESNCLRDWLAQRWQFPSLLHTSITHSECHSLSINWSFLADELADSKSVFESWIKHVLEDRALLEQCRK
jgi:hypothetical protein